MLPSRVSLAALQVLALGPASGGVAQAPEPATTDEVRLLCEAALDRTRQGVRYDPAYVRLEYPGGDVPADRGVCTDVIIRSYRTACGLDLQLLVHEHVRSDFGASPANWGLERPDRNIDHRRVPNLRAYWTRQGAELPVTRAADDYGAGDLVTWSVERRPHVGLVVDRVSRRSGRPMIVHDIGAGPRLEDCLFNWPLTGHSRWLPAAGGDRDAQTSAGSSGNSSR